MKRVVFVDDEALVLEALRDRLRAHRKRWDMHFVQDAQAALDALADARTDVVVTDVRMPKGGGIELLKQIRQEHPHVVRIVLSGDTGLKNAFAAVPVAHQWLTKPCSGDLLETTIERTCGLYDLLHNESLQEIVGGADTLPSLPKVYAELARTLADPRACAKHVAAVVEKDMAMCAKVLQLANSSFFGPKQRIVSLEGAVSYLGTTMIRSLILCAEVFRVFEAAKVDARSLEHLQAHALKTAQLAARLTTTHNGVEHFFAAGVLHDVGKLVLATSVAERFETILRAEAGIELPFQVVEEEILGVSVNVNHRPGGGGGVGWSNFQRTAKPSGYEVIGINIPHIVGQPMIRKDAGFTADGFKYVAARRGAGDWRGRLTPRGDDATDLTAPAPHVAARMRALLERLIAEHVPVPGESVALDDAV